MYTLNHINLKIDDNKFILLAGETGSGKTTLIRCMNGLIPQFYAGYYKGSIEIAGQKTTERSIADLSTIVGIVFQTPENQLIAMNAEHEIAFGMENLGISQGKIKEKIEEVVQLTNIEDILEKAPFEISGGEQQRVAIASVLALEPQILILDEPTANLDPYFAQKILKLLKTIQKEQHITIIIIEHRLDLVLPYVDEIILMKEGEILEQDTKEKVINGKIFKELKINKPLIYSIFHDLKERNLIEAPIPVSLHEAINLLKQKL
ncbi:MAG: putative HMP/thiamine import ATP-binding protein YkoD [Promethearchaeota archaeon]|nr:MAG: putative HMP/thiamine import ATP-binding protein YkoD [Candidatus Lokiarchaeota archaeon]